MCECVCVVSLKIMKILEVEWVSSSWLGVAGGRPTTCGGEWQKRYGLLWKIHSQGPGELDEDSAVVPLAVTENPGGAAQDH